jgi:hypothetical protein
MSKETRFAKNGYNFCECGDTRWLKEKKWAGDFIKKFVGYVSICVHCGAEWKDLRSDHHV